MEQLLEDNLLIEMRTKINGKEVKCKIAIAKSECTPAWVGETAKMMFDAFKKYKEDREKEQANGN